MTTDLKSRFQRLADAGRAIEELTKRMAAHDFPEGDPEEVWVGLYEVMVDLILEGKIRVLEPDAEGRVRFAGVPDGSYLS